MKLTGRGRPPDWPWPAIEGGDTISDEMEKRMAAVEARLRNVAVEVSRLGAQVASLEQRMVTELAANTSMILQRFDAFLPSFEANAGNPSPSGS